MRGAPVFAWLCEPLLARLILLSWRAGSRDACGMGVGCVGVDIPLSGRTRTIEVLVTLTDGALVAGKEIAFWHPAANNAPMTKTGSIGIVDRVFLRLIEPIPAIPVKDRL